MIVLPDGEDVVEVTCGDKEGWLVNARGPLVSVKLTPAAYAHGLALALPTKVAMARPTGFGHALATFEIPIEGRDE